MRKHISKRSRILSARYKESTHTHTHTHAHTHTHSLIHVFNIQVLLFNPETLVNRLSRMERPEEVPKQPRPKKQFDAFKNYSYGRWNLSEQPALLSAHH